MSLLSSLLSRLGQAFKTNPVSTVLIGLSGSVRIAGAYELRQLVRDIEEPRFRRTVLDILDPYIRRTTGEEG